MPPGGSRRLRAPARVGGRASLGWRSRVGWLLAPGLELTGRAGRGRARDALVLERVLHSLIQGQPVTGFPLVFERAANGCVDECLVPLPVECPRSRWRSGFLGLYRSPQQASPATVTGQGGI